MKKFVLFLLLVSIGSSAFSQKKIKKSYFTELENHIQVTGYEWRYEEGAKIFERIYLEHSKKETSKSSCFFF